MIAVLIMIIIGVAVFYGLYRMYKSNKEGCCSTTETIKKVKVADKDESNYPYTTVLKVSDMVCDNCSTRVSNALNELEGTYAKVNLTEKKVTVLSKIPPNVREYQQTLSNIGYPAIIEH